MVLVLGYLREELPSRLKVHVSSFIRGLGKAVKVPGDSTVST